MFSTPIKLCIIVTVFTLNFTLQKNPESLLTNVNFQFLKERQKKVIFKFCLILSLTTKDNMNIISREDELQNNKPVYFTV